MSTTLHINDEFDRLTIECNEDEPTVWIRTAQWDSVSLQLSRANRDALRAALDEADKFDLEKAA